MADADVAAQAQHVAFLEDFPHQTVALAQLQAAVPSDHAGGILTAVLQGQQGVVKQLIHRRLADDADDAAHQMTSAGSSGRVISTGVSPPPSSSPPMRL